VHEGADLPGKHKLGWVGAGGRMGVAMVQRLLLSGNDVLVHNRTSAKLAPLLERGATAASSIAELGECDIVFVTLGGDEDFVDVVGGPDGLAGLSPLPGIVVDLTTVSAGASASVRSTLAKRGVAFLAAPVSGNAKVVDAGLLSIVVSGPEPAFDEVRPYFEQLAKGVTYVGDGEQARFVKICHNLYLGIVIQGLIEITVLAEKAGIPRSAMLEFLNRSVMGSVFTGYKAPALVNLDFKPTFTLELLLKDLTLALDAAEELGVPLPLGGLAQQIVRSGVGNGLGELDFASLIELQARGAGYEPAAENVPVPTGLEGLAKQTPTSVVREPA
jgi:3-hydroxyisobutyrate dehydrogenase-like beta-hydroxyacid dehydrogenase